MPKGLTDAYLAISEGLPIEDVKVKQRLDRAYNILTGYGYTITKAIAQEGRYIYQIHRASTSLLEDNSAVYTTDSASCTCPDYASARGNLCKHRLAIMLVEEMAQ